MMLYILDHPWHQAHSYRLHALPASFWYYQVGTRAWDLTQRPAPTNFRGFIDHPAFMRRFDLVLSHIDNWCDMRYPLRGTPFRVINLIAKQYFPDALRVAIMHGAPDDGRNKAGILEMIENCPGGPPFVVTNSHQAFDEWGLGPVRSRAIVHGYDVDEFWSEKTRRREVLTVCSGGSMSREYHGIPMLERIMRDVPVTWVGDRGVYPGFPDYDTYRQYLASSLVYLHTGKQSPMPGARTEAMLSGCCVVTTDNHDVGGYIEHGYNGFVTNDVDEMIAILRGLLANPRAAYQIGKRGGELARSLFNKGRYVDDWLQLIADLGWKGTTA